MTSPRTESTLPIELVVGLENPGAAYAGTRHNVGGEFVSQLAAGAGSPLQEEKRYQARISRVRLGGREVRLLVPTTYMNRSGQAVGPIASFYRIPVQSILVVHDEIDLPAGVVRLKQGGGLAGNNGLRDITRALANARDYRRLRIGVGRPPAGQGADHVLGKPSPADRISIDAALDHARRHLGLLLGDNLNAAMNALHAERFDDDRNGEK